jgi:RHH-type proline utilization regulon transcriptional repressor/proline dehydrogenase/delta 1-pyrroline-5-carboxylate dehydrogenase
VTVSLSSEAPEPLLTEEAGVVSVTEGEAELIARLRSPGGFERLRVLDPVSLDVRTAAHEVGTVIIDAPALATGRLELRWYLREQTVSRVVHRYGNVMEPPAGDRSPLLEARRPAEG